MTRFIFIILVSVVVISCSEKQSMDSDKAKIVAQCEAFIDDFKDDNFHAAMEILKKNSIISNESIDALHTTIIAQESIFRRYGFLKSSDFIGEKKVKDYLSTRYYIVRFENYYSIFQFTLYKTSHGWRITHFKYDDEIPNV